MELGDFHKYRRLASLFALVGVLLYTALVPGHVISQATAHAQKGEFDLVVEMACHNGPVDTRDTAPSTPDKTCPFCKGYAAFMTALPGACDTGILDAERPQPKFTLLNEGVAEQAAHRPQNRGPPSNPVTS